MYAIKHPVPNYEEKIRHALSETRGHHSISETRNLDDLKLVIFSDHHRGVRDGADDFVQCQATYHGALGYYLEAGYELVLLGDVEELWEAAPEAIVAAYETTLRLEQQFAERGALKRFFGNHDDLWRNPDAVQEHLGPYLDESNHIYEGLELTVEEGGETLGTLFFVHGHQGTGLSDDYAFISRAFVRYIWRPLQRLLRFKVATPSTTYSLRLKFEDALYTWAAQQEGYVVIAGHSHRPVFSPGAPTARLLKELETLRQDLAGAASEAEQKRLQEEAGHKAAELHWMLARTESAKPFGYEKPCYFNTGCCSFSNGDITGLEIANGTIRLVRWPNVEKPKKQILRTISLKKVLERCKT